MKNLKVTAVICLLIGVTYSVGNAVPRTVNEQVQAEDEIKGRRKSGLSADGYTDTLAVPGQDWGVHDAERPEPYIIDPPKESCSLSAPSDATVLFDGTDLSMWQSGSGGEAEWKVEDGYMEVNGTGSIMTKESFGSCQLHIEFATPTPAEGKGQGRGNSGVMLMGKYEIQVLDSFENRTYSDGQTGAIYGQYPPLVNASRKPGEWQTYDIIFEAPEFDGDEVKTPAYVTVIHNGIVLHHRTEIVGAVAHKDPAQYVPHAEKLPLMLQDHNNPNRFRNVWIRPLTGYDLD